MTIEHHMVLSITFLKKIQNQCTKCKSGVCFQNLHFSLKLVICCSGDEFFVILIFDKLFIYFDV